MRFNSNVRFAAGLSALAAAVIAFTWMPGVATGQQVDKPLKVGDVAPDWELPGTDGKTYKLSQFRGKQAVVVSWYPKALTGG